MFLFIPLQVIRISVFLNEVFFHSDGTVPGYIVRVSESKTSEEGNNLLDFKYTCVGYSVVANSNDNLTGKPSDLPFCVGVEVAIFISSCII